MVRGVLAVAVAPTLIGAAGGVPYALQALALLALAALLGGRRPVAFWTWRGLRRE